MSEPMELNKLMKTGEGRQQVYKAVQERLHSMVDRVKWEDPMDVFSLGVARACVGAVAKEEEEALNDGGSGVAGDGAG